MKKRKQKTRVFLSFDFDKDKGLKDMVVGQARNTKSPINIEDWSLKEKVKSKNWTRKAKTQIVRSDLVLVLRGKDTHKASGVKKEVKIARKAGIPIRQLKLNKNSKDKPVRGAGRAVNWKWPALAKAVDSAKKPKRPRRRK